VVATAEPEAAMAVTAEAEKGDPEVVTGASEAVRGEQAA
jgi:hypothetical protein